MLANACREAAIFVVREASSARSVSFAEICFTLLVIVGSNLLLEEVDEAGARHPRRAAVDVSEFE